MMGGGRDAGDRAFLASQRVRIALQGHQPFSAAVQAVYNTLKALREGTKPTDLQGVASAETMRRVTRDGDYKSWTERFLGGEGRGGRVRSHRPACYPHNAFFNAAAIIPTPCCPRG